MTPVPKQWFAQLLSAIRAKPPVAGLEISDSVLRFARLENGAWQSASLRLPPGIIVGGRVKDHAQLEEALKGLHKQIVGSKSHEKISVVVSLSSVNVYTQIFSLPMIEGENLEKAIELNIQMVSPGETAETYSGWQMVNQDQKSVRLEILSAFINRAVVDDIHRGLKEAGFIVHSVESRALSLARLIREECVGFNPAASYILLGIDSSGIEVLVMRRSHLYFQYFNSWQDIQGDDRQISVEKLETVITRNFQQVLNFYNSHWADPLEGIFVAAGGLEELAVQIIRNHFASVPIKDLSLRIKGDLSSDWFVALGSALRGLVPGREDKDISLLGLSAQEDFRQHQAISFAAFWRMISPVSLSILLTAFLLADFLAMNVADRLEHQVKEAAVADIKEISDLQTRAKAFNRAVSMLQSIDASLVPKFQIASRLNTHITARSGAINRFSIQSIGTPASLSGEVKSEEELSAFKKAMDQDSVFQGVTLPLTGIKRLEGGKLSFSMTFSIVPEKTR